MARTVFILIFLILFVNSCTKEDAIPTSGITTIDNTLQFSPSKQAYFAFGFLFSKAEKVSTLSSPTPDITVDSDGTNIFFSTNNYKNSFFKSGEYPDESSASNAFKNLTSVDVTQWQGLASPLGPHQVWIYRSGSELYAKIRIISTVSEVRDNRNYAECTFEWAYQPDGSTTFPAQ